MVLFNHSTHELTAKIVYYGPGLCGKTTNLRLLHDRLEKGTAGRLLSLATAQDRTIYFDLLPVELGNIKGYTVRFQLCTVPGQVFYNETRKLVLRGVDGIVFVVDSQWSMVSHNLESWQNLVENLRDLSMGIESLPVVVQYNKRDLAGVLTVDALQESLGFPSYPFVEAVASTGQGVVETFKLISKLTFVDLLRRLQRTGTIETDALPASGGKTDPGEETFVRAGPPARRSSFAAEPVPHAAPEPPAEAPAAVAEKEPPFGADAPAEGWIAANDSDVFGVPEPEPVAADQLEPFGGAAVPAPEPESIAAMADVEQPEAPPPAPHAGPAVADAALRERLDRNEAALAQMQGEVAALRGSLQALRSELGGSVEKLASSLEAAERRTRGLADGLRRAIDELKE